MSVTSQLSLSHTAYPTPDSKVRTVCKLACETTHVVAYAQVVIYSDWPPMPLPKGRLLVMRIDNCCAPRPTRRTFTRTARLVDSDSPGPPPAPQIPRFFDQINGHLIQSMLGAWRRLWAMAAWADGGNTKPLGIVFKRSAPAPFCVSSLQIVSLSARVVLSISSTVFPSE